MAWDDDYEDDFFVEENDDMDLMDVEDDEDYISDTLEDELDFELYEQEKENADSDDFPETFEEWKIQKEQEKWDYEDEMDDSDMMEEYEE